jgi:hypothetical protein
MKIPLKPILILTAGILVGLIGLMTYRLATYKNEYVHYHANFAVYINGQRESFKSPLYYSESSCSVENVITPGMRAHMHSNVSDVVHVEDHAVTWGNFFENLWWSVGSDFIQKSDGTMYKADGTNKLHVYINGQDYTDLGSIANRQIVDKDRVLISYGNDSKQTLEKQFASIASSAAKEDTSTDPASCGGSHKTTIKDKIKHLI